MVHFKILLSSATVAFLSVYLLAKWVFWEPSDAQKGSLAYTLKVPSEAKNFPIWNAIKFPKFDVNITDGEKPSATVLHYDSSLRLNELKELATKLDFSCKQYERNAVLCDKTIDEDRTQQVIFQVNNNEQSQVEVLFIGY